LIQVNRASIPHGLRRVGHDTLREILQRLLRNMIDLSKSIDMGGGNAQVYSSKRAHCYHKL